MSSAVSFKLPASPFPILPCSPQLPPLLPQARFHINLQVEVLLHQDTIECPDVNIQLAPSILKNPLDRYHIGDIIAAALHASFIWLTSLWHTNCTRLCIENDGILIAIPRKSEVGAFQRNHLKSQRLSGRSARASWQCSSLLCCICFMGLAN